MITAIVLAAGQSKRMGQPKMLLPWGERTVLGQVLATLRQIDISNIVVVTGAQRTKVEKICASFETRVAHNPDYTNDEMLISVQVGLKALIHPPSLRDTSPIFGEVGAGWEGEAALIVLGDQPQIQEGSVRAVLKRFVETKSNLVVPSFKMRRGHPWLAARPLWDEILQMQAPQTPRDFLNCHAGEIEYINVNTASILADLDTPEDYLKSRP